MKTSTRFGFGRWLCLTLMVGLIVSLTYFAYAHKDTDSDSARDAVKNASCGASAQHYHFKQNNGYYRNHQWAGFSASLGTKGNPIGFKVDGKYTIDAYVTAEGRDYESHPFTLKVGGFKIFGKEIKWGDSTMDNVYDSTISYSPTKDGYAKAKAEVGSAKTKQCKT